MRRMGFFLVLLTTISVGCTQEEPAPSPTPTVPTIAAGPLPEGWRRCVNDEKGWSIGYPAAWFTTDRYTDPFTGDTKRQPSSACMLFDPRRFMIPGDGEPPETALQVSLASGPVEMMIGYLLDPTYWRLLAREEAVVLGMPAVRLEVESLGGSLELKGTLRYGWMVDLGDNRSFSVFAVAQPGTTRDQYLEYREVARLAIATVEFGSATPSA
ncbi:MAG TPA: hypothetical protein VFR44_09770 [Actinomycetota bacterium]|nr:hypothetical protein [Actinomycetota bacterium]